MGQEKHRMQMMEERGWSAPDGFVCADCVEDDFLKGLVKQNLARKTCTYCGKKALKDIACPAEALMPAIAGAVFHYFEDPVQAGVPYDEGLVDWGMPTSDVLRALSIDGNEKFVAAVANAFHHQMWVQAAGGMWTGTHEHDELLDSWEHFVHTVKHRTRFHFHLDTASDRVGTSADSPGVWLDKLGSLVERARLVQSVEAGTPLFRARVRRGGAWSPSSETMGPPPVEVATSGRMNPAGISYLYTALEDGTALAEAVSAPPQDVVLATYSVARPLSVVDLCTLPPAPSIFDVEKLRLHDGLWFLYEFVREISKPVSKHVDERIEYVPTQVVCEWFAQVFEPRGEGSRVDGLMYPSAVRPGGRNLVLFPRRDGRQWVFDAVTYLSASELSLNTWADIQARIACSR